MLALQCTLRADAHGRACLPAGLLRAMRLHGRAEVWGELAHGAWLQPPDLRSALVKVQLLDATVQDQIPGRSARRRAAHWALKPAPLTLPSAAPPALRLMTLILAAHTCDRTVHCAEMDVLAHLCGHSPHQTAELLDRLVATRTLSVWHHDRAMDEVTWQLPHVSSSPAPGVAPASVAAQGFSWDGGRRPKHAQSAAPKPHPVTGTGTTTSTASFRTSA
ncbi:hypothetical protein AB0O67_37260 [Streptomyces sp. NPDC086077]|uniref:hypothetical protein n=1 Tax=Streptomyces sp. NPDC086077 TaxID=3154862 RepID=UPI003430EE99